MINYFFPNYNLAVKYFLQTLNNFILTETIAKKIQLNLISFNKLLVHVITTASQEKKNNETLSTIKIIILL
jgi:hypothetical protein